MKLKVLFLIAIMIVTLESQSQVKPFRFGVKLAPNLGWISPDTEAYENDGVRMGFSWGFLADITLTENYFVKTGFSIDYLNAGLEYDHLLELNENDQTLTQGKMSRNYKLRYLEIPLTLKMRTNKFGKIAFYGEIGFGTAFNLKAKSDDTFNFGTGELEKEEDIKDEIAFIRESLILGGGIEYFIDESTSIITSINFSNGLTNVLKGETSFDPEIKQRGQLTYLQLNVGVMF